MPSDSIIAKPTNRVRVTVPDTSGCCARALSADEMALLSPMAGAMEPMHMVSPAVTNETTAIKPMLSITYASEDFVAAAI